MWNICCCICAALHSAVFHVNFQASYHLYWCICVALNSAIFHVNFRASTRLWTFFLNIWCKLIQTYYKTLLLIYDQNPMSTKIKLREVTEIMWCPVKKYESYQCSMLSMETTSFLPQIMMTSINGNIFGVTGLLRFFVCFLWSPPEKRLSKQSRRRWFETPSRSLWRHCNVIKWPVHLDII